MTFDNSIKPQMFWEAYARYFLAATAIYEACMEIGLDTPTVLEIGSNGEKYLNEFLPEAKVIPLNSNSENIMENLDDFIIADATDMREIADSSYDFVISCAVLEHIPPFLHKAFLKESFRVARIGVFHAAPQESEYVYQAERTVSNFNELLYGEKHRWIEEHLQNGHPDIKKISLYCEELGMDYSVFQHMDYQLWTSFYCFWLENARYSAEFLAYLNTYYQQELFFRDVGPFNIFIYLYISKYGPSSSTILEGFKNKLKRTNREQLLGDFQDMQQHLRAVFHIKRENEIFKQQCTIQNQFFSNEKISIEYQKKIIEQINNLLIESKNKNAVLIKKMDRWKELNDTNTCLFHQYESLKKKLNKVQEQRMEIQSLKESNFQLCNELNRVKNSTTWRLTKPLRILADMLKKYKHLLCGKGN